ncbi:MAG: 5-(carboxyamino)imidazole ribonucleotide synthase [Thermodesulfobacteriota bacterium]
MTRLAAERPVPPCAPLRVGILGGGQLARMTADAARRLGIDTVVIDPEEEAPAGQVTRQIVGPLKRGEALVELARQIDVATLENEFVDLEALEYLAHHGVMVRPSIHTFGVILDKLHQRERIAAAGLGATPFADVTSQAEVHAFAQRHGWPVVLKTRSQGYDGRGVAIAREARDLPAAWERLGAGVRALMAEGFVDFEREVAVMVVRNAHGEALAYPVVDTVQEDYVCRVVRAPADVPADVAASATDVALRAVEAIEGIGVHGVELFVAKDGRVSVNEIAPRPHNSGHYTIDACVTSQFENHLRAVVGLPLGPVAMTAPAAVMVNLLATRHGDAARLHAGARRRGEAWVYLYGKRELRPGRKMGHVTAIGETREEAERRAIDAARALGL